MRDSLFHLERKPLATLQAQIRELLVAAMLDGQLPAESAIPSTRAMARRLKVSRNTVTIAYQALSSDGYLVARERSGFYVAAQVRSGIAATKHLANSSRESPAPHPVKWADRLVLRPLKQNNIVKPANWHDYPYPFIYGQADATQFPIAAWRDCVRQAMSRKWMEDWTDDRFNADDPELVEQIRQRILTRRGVLASHDEIMVTMGAQNALYLLAQLLVGPQARVAIEDPGYPDMRNMFALSARTLMPVACDSEGIRVDRLGDATLVYVTPSHQFPTNVTMSLSRRRELLGWAARANAIVIEDDYEFETNYRGEPTPALKSMDEDGRVIHVGSLSKSLMPGLRMGFLVAPAELVAELRALRRLVYRHPPGNNQRVVALFLAQGLHDALIGRLHRAYRPRWQQMGLSLDRHFPGWAQSPGFGGTSYWVRGPATFDAQMLAEKALKVGVVIEPGAVFFADPKAGRNYFRLGYSSIPLERIEPGIARLASVAQWRRGTRQTSEAAAAAG